ncbi:conserved hypothetical protein [Gammaproteobacteria bacterium]
MKLMLSGEGKTDMGQEMPGATGLEYVSGPMAYVVDRLVESRMGYSLLEMQSAGGECVQFVDKTELSKHELTKHCKSGPTLLPGDKYGKGNTYFRCNAQALALLAKSEQSKTGEQVVAILFRDADGTVSKSHDEWRKKVGAMKSGFRLANFLTGVPMVPHPKSEAWLLCGLKDYANCKKLEDASGNDASPNSLKKQLRDLVGHDPTAEEQTDWIKSGRIDPDRIDMPSFSDFREALKSALDTALSFQSRASMA